MDALELRWQEAIAALADKIKASSALIAGGVHGCVSQKYKQALARLYSVGFAFFAH
jgi:hypothetical protein